MKAEEWRKNVCTRWNVVIHSNLSSNTFGHRVRYKVNAMRSLFQAHTGFLSLAFYSHWIATWKRDYVCSVITLQIYLKQFCSVEQKTFDLFGSLALSLSLFRSNIQRKHWNLILPKQLRNKRKLRNRNLACICFSPNAICDSRKHARGIRERERDVLFLVVTLARSVFLWAMFCAMAKLLS